MSSTNFNLNSKKLFLTYSQCSLSKEVIMEELRLLFGERIEWIIIGREDHTEDGKHLHCLVALKNRLSIRNPRYCDIKANNQIYHPKLENARNLNRAIIYVCKDKDVLAEGTDWKLAVKNAKSKKNSKAAIIAIKLQEGATINDIDEEYPGYTMMNLKKLEDYVAFQNQESFLESTLKKFQGCLSVQNKPWEVQMTKWINSNLTMASRPHKKKQLWIHGATNTGKTWVLNSLSEYFRGYEIPIDANWYDDYSDKYQFAYLDEFKAGKTIQFLNRFAEGVHMKLPQRHKRCAIKKKNMPLIICSNLPPEEVYHRSDPLIVDALKQRFIIIHIPYGERIRIEFNPDLECETCPMLSDEEFFI